MSDQCIALAAWLGFAVVSLGGCYALMLSTCAAHRAIAGALWSVATLSTVATLLWLGAPSHGHAALTIGDGIGQMPAMPITAMGE